MNKKILSIFASAAVLGGALGLTSCADDLDLSNPDMYDSQNFWRSEANFTGNLVALMAQWRSNYDQMVMFQAGELRTDYYWPNGGTDGTGLRNTEFIRNQYDAVNYQFDNFANIYGMVSNCNTFLYYDELRGDILDTNCREYLRGMIYGMRAWCFFQLHKMYGTAPLRITADVILGNYDEVTLRMPRSTAEELLDQIKKDIDASLTHFNNAGNYTNSLYSGNRKTNFWTKAATEMLAGETYLWSGKVSTLDHKATGATDVAKAKTYFENVINNYGFQLMPTYDAAINTNAGNTETIFATYYNKDEATTNWFNYIMYDVTTGGSPGNFWSAVGEDGVTPSTTAQRLTWIYNPATGTRTRTQFYLTRMQGQQHYAVRNAFYRQFDKEDSRIDIFMPIYLITPEQDSLNVQYVENFNPDDYILAGCYVRKYHGSMGDQGVMVGTNFMQYYRLALAYMYLAEIANYEGDNATVVKYINEIRKRAYGDNWDESKFGYKAGSFLDNEIAILQEKAKEFFQEGQRWWDLRRMTAVKDGQDKDHLVFRKEACIGHGLDLAAHPNWYEVTPTYTTLGRYTIDTDSALLNYDTQKHIVLWPVNQSTLQADDALTQTPGYSDDIPWIEN
ncbi:MAG: RagB/SusD family nutrient uptake outer membrane protein [Clostridium sp.]|nr:RagB/SusD family nutrient uptake outer membrane protein [Clostridium sp.]